MNLQTSLIQNIRVEHTGEVILIVGFLIEMTIKMGIFYIVMYLTGLLVVKKGVKVNYTRKINHFTLLVVPFLLVS